MLNPKVNDICLTIGGFKNCPQCPLYDVCGMPNDEIPGDTLAEKTAWWEARMNEAADEFERSHHEVLR